MAELPRNSLFVRPMHKGCEGHGTLHHLLEVIHADDRVSDYEVTFFNHVARALELTPAQIIGLSAD